MNSPRAALVVARPQVGSVAWERAGGPPLSFGERAAQLGRAARVLGGHLGGRLRSRLAPRRLPKVDLARCAPPDSSAAREAERHLREVSTVPMAHHCFRAYYFAAVLCELEGAAGVDREALYVAAVMHDVGLGQPRPPGEHCFTVACAREARRIAAAAGWDEARQDRMALAIVANVNGRVGRDQFSPEAYFFTVGGMVEVLAQGWKLHPDNLAEILARHPREGYTDDILAHLRREMALDPGGRFACLDPLFPALVRRAAFP